MLFQSMDIVKPYPEAVSPVGRMVDGTAFFPGGRGLWMDEDTDVFPSILVLGHDFSTEKWYLRMLNGEVKDISSPTWINMIRLFLQANVDIRHCFFTNVFMGLRRTESMTGVFPGFRDKGFVERNVQFLSFQIEAVKPKVIVTLGKYAAEMLAGLSPEDLSAWKGWRALKEKDVGLVPHVRLGNLTCACVALEHPSMRNSNVKRRRYKNCSGNVAEVMMLMDALAEL